MPPVLHPGTRSYGGLDPVFGVPWPGGPGDYVFGRIRGTYLSIWHGQTAIYLRHQIDAGSCPEPYTVYCHEDAGLTALTCLYAAYKYGSGSCAPNCYLQDGVCGEVTEEPVGACGPLTVVLDCGPLNGDAVGGNIQDDAIPNYETGGPVGINYNMEAISFSVAGGGLDMSFRWTWTASPPSIGPFTMDGVTFPANTGPGAGAYADALGGSAWMGRWSASDGSKLYVMVLSGATMGPSVGEPLADWVPNWTPAMWTTSIVNGGMQVLFYSAPGSGGGTPGCASCRTTGAPAPPGGPGAGPCYSVSADDVITDICKRAGLNENQIDTSLLTDGVMGGNILPTNLVKGYVIERQTSAADVIRQLMQAYIFDACESDGLMRFVPRGLASALTIPESDLGLEDDKAEAVESFAQEWDIPRRMQVIYQDPLYLYQPGKQEKQRNSRLIQSRQQQAVNLSMVMDPDWARQVAEKLLYILWLERDSFQFNLGRASSLLLDPTDVIQFVYQGLTFRIRIKENSIGQGYAVEIKGPNDNTNNYLSGVQGGSQAALVSGAGPNGQLPGGASNGQRGFAPTWMQLLDIPLLEDTDTNPGGTGKYGAFSSPQPNNWPGAQLYTSTDDASFKAEGDPETVAAAYGTTTSTLADPSAAPWTLLPDTTNTVTIQLFTGSAAADVLANVEKGSNWFLIGNEVVGAVNVHDNGDGTLTLSHLLRGLRGTEWACGWQGDSNTGTNTHATGELVIMLSASGMPLGSSGVVRYQDPLSVINVLTYCRGVTLGQDITTASDDDFTITGQDLMPYAPIKVGGDSGHGAGFDANNNLIITWQRRTRIGGDNWGNQQGSTFPLSETTELYDVEILNGAGTSVVRTISGLASPTCIYLETQQVADFGSVQSSYKVNVYQRSAQVGRGFKGHGIAPAANGLAPVYPGSGAFYVNGT